MHWFAPSLTFFIDSFIHWFVHSLTPWFIDPWLTHWPIESLLHSFADSLIQWFTVSLVPWFIDSSVHWFIQSAVRGYFHVICISIYIYMYNVYIYIYTCIYIYILYIHIYIYIRLGWKHFITIYFSIFLNIFALNCSFVPKEWFAWWTRVDAVRVCFLVVPLVFGRQDMGGPKQICCMWNCQTVHAHVSTFLSGNHRRFASPEWFISLTPLSACAFGENNQGSALPEQIAHGGWPWNYLQQRVGQRVHSHVCLSFSIKWNVDQNWPQWDGV